MFLWCRHVLESNLHKILFGLHLKNIGNGFYTSLKSKVRAAKQAYVECLDEIFEMFYLRSSCYSLQGKKVNFDKMLLNYILEDIGNGFYFAAE